MATVLILRTCSADGTSTNGFRWPKDGPVEAPDWNPEPVCGGGLHGLLWGAGDSSLLDWAEDAKWLVVEVEADEIVDLGGKVKFPRGEVVYCGDRAGAGKIVSAKAPPGMKVVCGTATAGDAGTATAGDEGTATAGDKGTATAGDKGTATAGDEGTATAKKAGLALTGHCGRARADDQGCIAVRWWDAAAGRYRLAVGYVGENGIKPNVWYRVRDGHLVDE
jgi:hypothetical protein